MKSNLNSIRLPLLLTLFFGGCSSQVSASDAGLDLADLRPLDARPAADLFSPPDLYGGICAGKKNTRICSQDHLTSGLCDDSLTFQPDWTCVAGCESGYCKKPQSPVTCDIDADCKDTGSSPTYCQLFTDDFNMYGKFCATPAGPGANLDPCQQSSDCRSNLCYTLAKGPSCVKPCGKDADCDGSVGSCGPGSFNIEGFKDTVFICNR